MPPPGAAGAVVCGARAPGGALAALAALDQGVVDESGRRLRR